MKRPFRLLAVLLFLGTPTRASAAPDVVPPRAIQTPAPDAPDDGKDEPSVVLDLVVGTGGTVLSAIVVEGPERLAALARAAALSWTFEPARRGDVAVSAKIRVRVDFRRRPAPAPTPPEPPAGTPVAPPARPSDAASASRPGSEPAPEEVTIRGTRAVHGPRPLAPHIQLLASEVREIPGAFGDAFRAIEAMPGVTPIVSGVPYFVIRGAPPGDTGFFIDGIRIPSLFHFGVGEAVIHPALVQSVDLYAGVYPARFGRFAGGILSGEAVPPSDKVHGETAVRILDTGALVEAPFANGHGDALVSGRFGYPGLILSLAAPDVRLWYWDYQARAGYRFDDGSRVSVFGFGSYDSVSARDNGGPLQQVLEIAFDRVAARYTRPTAYSGELKIEATAGRDQTSIGTPALTLNSQLYSLAAGWSGRASEQAYVRIGADVTYQPYRFGGGSGDTTAGGVGGGEFNSFLPSAQDDLSAGIYGELSAKLSSRLSAEVGARFDLFTATYPGAFAGDPTTQARQVPAFDPRLSIRYAITPAVTWTSALGIAHQASNIPLPIPALEFSQLGRGLQTAYQMSEGVEAKLPLGFSASATGYLNNLTGLAQLTNNCPNDAPASCASTTVNGRSYGLELLVRRSLTERLTGWLSYTLSRSERDAFDGTTGAWSRRLSEFDRPHVVNVIGAYDLGANWRAGARVVAYSGWPYSTVSATGTPNARMPAFYRLDLRLEKRWPKPWGHVSFIAEWLNVLLSKEEISVSCNGVANGQSVCTPQQVGPITVPSLGVEVAF